MERLWAPWRIQYILGERPADTGCIFCEKPNSGGLKKELVLLKRDKCFALMNLYPYNSGHIMVAPYEHASCLTELSEEVNAAVVNLARALLPAMRKVMRPDGFNIGYNLGKVAGAGIHEHLHLHIVPRWSGDSNLLPVLGETRVISEHIEDTYDRLRKQIVEDGLD